MARRSPGFVSKKPHRKSRGGCMTCKKKKVKCDEAQPVCGYCSLRKLGCEYPQDPISAAKSPSPVPNEDDSLVGLDQTDEVDFNDTSVPLPGWIIPATNTSIGQFTDTDFHLLDHYKTCTWRTFAIRGEGLVDTLHRETIPRLSIAYPFLLYALLSMAAAHSNFLSPSKEAHNQALIYRQKTFQAYRNALLNINNENYEAILVTGLYLGAVIPRPQEVGEETEDCLAWMFSLLKLNEGLRILAGLRWTSGIEKLSVYPMLRRELQILPPAPAPIVSSQYGIPPIPTLSGPLGTTPDYPNPPSTYDTLQVLSFMEKTVFLPPCLMNLLNALVSPVETGSFDLDGSTLVPALHALSPIFTSLYYNHLSQDFYVRVFAFNTFLMPDFMQLVQNREPRAFALLAWRFCLATLVPQGWWSSGNLRKVVEAIGTVVLVKGNALTIQVYQKGLEIIKILETQGREQAARSVFKGWEGVNWDDGPKKAEEWVKKTEEWEMEIPLNLNKDLALG